MNLPSEIRDRKWAIEYADGLGKLSIIELMDEAIGNANPDDYDGCWTTRGYWRSIIANMSLAERVAQIQAENAALRQRVQELEAELERSRSVGAGGSVYPFGGRETETR